VTLEEKVGDAIGTSIQLLEPEMLTEGSPFRTIGALTHYIATRPV
jgi:hypothetical protein